MASVTFNTEPTLVACQDCDWQGSSEETKPIQDFERRVAPGEICPYGECPECGTVCHAVEIKGKIIPIRGELRTFTIQCAYAAYYTQMVTVRAPDVETALHEAIRVANCSSVWKSCDDVGETFIDQAAEGGQEGLWSEGTIDIPFDFTEAALHAKKPEKTASLVDSGGG